MANKSFQQFLDTVTARDSRYAAGAYIFVRMALDYTVKKLRSADESRVGGNISTEEFLEGLKDFALESFGPIAYTVLEEWGVKSTDDFGEIVFNMIDGGELRGTEDDKKEDFNSRYSFKTVFLDPYLPQK